MPTSHVSVIFAAMGKRRHEGEGKMRNLATVIVTAGLGIAWLSLPASSLRLARTVYNSGVQAASSGSVSCTIDCKRSGEKLLGGRCEILDDAGNPDQIRLLEVGQKIDAPSFFNCRWLINPPLTRSSAKFQCQSNCLTLE